MTTQVKIILSLVIILFAGFSNNAQDIETITKADPIKVNGSVSTSATYYNAFGIDNRRPPFYWTINANLNFNFFGVISAPFTLNFSPQGNQFNYPYQQMQPFNKMGISPKYKWLTVHLGYRSMNFSSYTYSGNSFNGVGVEVKTKKNWDVSAFYGRLAKAITEAENNNLPGLTLYDRWAYGTKFKYGTSSHNVELIVFKAWDNPQSLLLTEQKDENPAQDNTVVGINTEQAITKKLKLKIEYSLSAYTKNAESNNTGTEAFSYLNGFGGLYAPRTSSQYNSAINSSINYQHQKFNIGLNYRRVDPEYESMGIPFLNNDMEDITANLSWRMLKNKVNFTTSGGFQRNNLNDEQAGRTVRLIGSINSSYAISSKWNVNAGYSNFNTSTVKTRIELLDSLEYYQVTQNANLGTNYQFGNNKVAHAVMVMGNYQNASDIQENNSVLYNGAINYAYNVKSSGVSISVGLNGNINSVQGLENKGWGPSVSVAKPFFNKQLRSSLGFNMLSYQNNGAVINQTYNSNLSLTYTLKKKHNFGINMAYILKNDFAGNNSFSEYRGSIKYGYSF